MGNAGTYVFAYVFVSQSPVAGHALAMRWALAGLLLVACGAVLLHRHGRLAAGVCMGFSSRYFWNNVLNCFGALLLASASFGAAGSAALRVGENLAGVAFALACAALWSWTEGRNAPLLRV